MPMPSVTDLQSMYGAWNPQAYLEAQNNAGLERQFRESQFGEQQAQTRQRELANTYSEQEQPGKMENQRLTNQNLGYTGQGLSADARTKGVAADVAEAGKQFKINEQQRQELLAVPAHEIAMGEKHAQQLMMSLDPEVRKQGEQLYNFTKFARDEKAKADRAMELEKFKQLQQTGRDTERNQSAERIAQIGADSRLAVKQVGSGGGGGSIVGSLSKQKVPERLGTLKAILTSGINPDTKEPLTPTEQALFAAMYQQDAATTDANLAARAGQGTVPNVAPSGDITLQNKVPPTVNTQVPQTGKTKSGISYKVVP